MNYTKFKIGDKVRITNASSIEPHELNAIGVIADMVDYDTTWKTCIVDMGRPRRVNEEETCWWLTENKIELAVRKGEQLQFSFMNE